MILKKNDFIEIEFTAKIKDGDIFDSNIKEDLKGKDLKTELKPFIFSLGHGMFLDAIDNFLIGKEVGEFNIKLPPEKAFGKREANLIQMMPIKIFIEQEINPIPGIMFNFDGRIGKILTVTGGRVMVDFNNPIAGKNVEYKIKILRKVDDSKEKVSALLDFLFKEQMDFEIKDEKLILNVEKAKVKFIEMFQDKFKEILNLNLEVREKKEEVREKKEEVKEEKVPEKEEKKEEVKEEKVQEKEEKKIN